MLVNHPLMPFLGWRDEHAGQFYQLGARIEIGVLAERIEFEEYADDSFVRPIEELDWGIEALPEAGAGRGEGEE